MEARLPEEELRRAARLRVRADRLRFIVGRGALRLLLGRALDAVPEALEICGDPRGRPRLSGPWSEADVSFNVSHSGDWVLVGLARSAAVGVDVERLRAIPDMEVVGRRSFSPDEMEWFGSLSSEDRVRGFYTCWTRKEAYVKAIGMGLSKPLGSFTVPLSLDGPGWRDQPQEFRESGRSWLLWGPKPAAGYEAAIVTDRPEGRLRARRWSGTQGEVPW